MNLKHFIGILSGQFFILTFELKADQKKTSRVSVNVELLDGVIEFDKFLREYKHLRLNQVFFLHVVMKIAVRLGLKKRHRIVSKTWDVFYRGSCMQSKLSVRGRFALQAILFAPFITGSFFPELAQAQSCQKDRLPPKPANFFEIASVKADGTLPKAFIPTAHTTHDGRIAVAVPSHLWSQNLPNGNLALQVYLLKPELENQPGSFERNAGDRPALMIDYDRLSQVHRRIEYEDIINKTSPAHQYTVFTNAKGQLLKEGHFGHVAICDSVTQNQAPSSPIYIASENVDEYNFKILAFESDYTGGPGTFFSQFNVKIRVKFPKTTNAVIESLNIGNVIQRKWDNVTQGLEPMITEDGRLMVFRGPDIVYSYNVNGPCDPYGWSTPRKILSASVDPRLRDPVTSQPKYDFIRYPFRDTMGNLLSNDQNAVLAGSYPWIDRKGKNLFFFQVEEALTAQNKDGDFKLEYRCADWGQGCYNTDINGGRTRGLSVMGLWTHGKSVMLDNALNDADYIADAMPHSQRSIKAYSGNTNVRIAGGRHSGKTDGNIYVNSPELGMLFANGSILHSVENKFNYLTNAKPKTPRDVVWKMSRGYRTDEVVFDEYNDPNYLIYSEMSGAINANTYYNGFQNRIKNVNGCFTGEVRVQNAATTPIYGTPAYGSVTNDNVARIEPVALGGIRGRGLNLRNANALKYNLPANPKLSGKEGYLGAFFESRNSNGKWIELFRTPSQARVQFLRKANAPTQIRFIVGSQIKEVTLKTKFFQGAWFHIGIHEAAGNVFVTVNGNERLVLPAMDLRLLGNVASTTTLFVGSSAPASGAEVFNGWVDDVRLIANASLYRENPEMACNLARGSLLQRVNAANSSRQTEINIFNLPGASQAGAFCNTDYKKDGIGIWDSHLGLSTSDFKSIRELFTVQGHALLADQPRLNSSANKFCLSCHISSNPTSGDGRRPASLSLEALKPINQRADRDHRRQPMQPDPLWSGFLPAKLLFNSRSQTMGPVAPVTCNAPKLCRVDQLVLGVANTRNRLNDLLEQLNVLPNVGTEFTSGLQASVACNQVATNNVYFSQGNSTDLGSSVYGLKIRSSNLALSGSSLGTALYANSGGATLIVDNQGQDDETVAIHLDGAPRLALRNLASTGPAQEKRLLNLSRKSIDGVPCPIHLRVPANTQANVVLELNLPLTAGSFQWEGAVYSWQCGANATGTWPASSQGLGCRHSFVGPVSAIPYCKITSFEWNGSVIEQRVGCGAPAGFYTSNGREYHKQIGKVNSCERLQFSWEKSVYGASSASCAKPAPGTYGVVQQPDGYTQILFNY